MFGTWKKVKACCRKAY